ncbi:hypothetical protein [Paenibacillus tepidiphilus]|uniref:hypothetical protein n=1 Tax=Paenibacillus tepidiphilus TaxID=2608683 RepID=UPI00123ACBED|nr:hypothetical protein [Paenibacillus tepidiphilus]
MQIIDTFGSMIELREQILREPERYFDYWEDYAVNCFPELKHMLEVDSQAYDRERDIRPVALAVLTSGWTLLQETHYHLETLIPEIQERFASLFPASREVLVYFYIGLCNGAGWATKVGNTNAVLLGAEKIVELKWHTREAISGLLCHELCHIAHSDLRRTVLDNTYSGMDQRAVWQLYIEGFAQRYEQVLLAQDDFYHQDDHGWLDGCQRNRAILAKEYLRRIRLRESVRDFFGDWNSFQGRPDTGYYLGREFIASLEPEYSVEELARFRSEEITPLLVAFLERCR